MAKKYFGQEDALGKTLRLDNGGYVTVTGVLANIPANSHLQFDFILPMSSIAKTTDDIRNSVWGNFNFYIYVQLDKSFIPTAASLARFNGEMNRIFRKHIPESVAKITFELQPLSYPGELGHFRGGLPGLPVDRLADRQLRIAEGGSG
jgi:putative ABC transport system permease protein